MASKRPVIDCTHFSTTIPTPALKKVRKSISLETKLEVLARYERGESTASIKHSLQLSESTLRTIRNNASKIKRSANAGVPLTSAKSSYARSDIMERMEKMLRSWMMSGNARRVASMSYGVVKEKASEIYELLKSQTDDEVKPFAASLGWFMNFQRRCGYRETTTQGESATADDIQRIYRELNDRESASTSGESSFGATDVAAESRVPSNIVEDGSMSEEITGSSNSIYIQESSHDTGIINSDTVESAFDRYVSTEPLGNKMNDSLSRCKPTICEDYVADSVSTKNEVEDDEFDAFGRYIAASLRKMPAENALSVENRIYTVINSERKLILLNDRNKSDDNVLEIKVEVQDEPL